LNGFIGYTPEITGVPCFAGSKVIKVYKIDKNIKTIFPLSETGIILNYTG